VKNVRAVEARMQKPGHETKRIVDFYYLEQQMQIVTLKSLCRRCIFREKWSRRFSQIAKTWKNEIKTIKIKRNVSRQQKNKLRSQQQTLFRATIPDPTKETI